MINQPSVNEDCKSDKEYTMCVRCVYIYIYTWDKEWTQLFSVYLLLHINSDHYANGNFFVCSCTLNV